MLNKIILGGLALVCLVNIASSAPGEEYGETLDYIDSFINTEERSVGEEGLDIAKRDNTWRIYFGRYKYTPNKKGYLNFNQKQPLVLNLDLGNNGSFEKKWVKGYKLDENKKWVYGWVPSNFVFASKKYTTKTYKEPKI
ncbi:unnamed protein product [Owenia fusiformis]|uniref:Uncharacterized protein n=1 Tax=Owenia fusiformis TaxID=6347 RepID=A0A8J1TE38_OWEFU|nr:unnamed protein product [Owenia fusiformis]